MSGLAHIAMDMGCIVSGSDVAESSMLPALRRRGAEILIGHGNALPEGTDLLVYSSAVPPEDAERRAATNAGIRQIRRGDFLSLIALQFKHRIAVSGSHGKTSTSAMIAHVMRKCGLNPGFMVGGNVNGWERSASAGNMDILVTEVDESDGSQMSFPATTAVVLNIDDDHSWGLGGTEALENCFLQLASHADNVVTWTSETTSRLWGKDDRAVFVDHMLENGITQPGWHNRMNGAVAVKVCEMYGIKHETALAELKSFDGVARRMSRHFTSSDGRLVFIEDYAHHPSELKASLDALDEAYPGYRKMVVFQPHRLERVERYGARFAELLNRADWCGLVETFGAWRTDGRTVNLDGYIADKMNVPCVCISREPGDIVSAVKHALDQNDDPAVVVLIGAGDVGKAVPYINEMLKNR